VYATILTKHTLYCRLCLPCSSPVGKYWLTHVTMERNALDFVCVCVCVCIHTYILIPAFYGVRNFVTAFTTARHFSCFETNSSSRRIQRPIL
jgi:hypothetical protein